MRNAAPPRPSTSIARPTRSPTARPTRAQRGAHARRPRRRLRRYAPDQTSPPPPANRRREGGGEEEELRVAQGGRAQAAFMALGAGRGAGSTPQMTLAYSEMVRSVENCAMLEQAWMLKLAHFALSW